MKDSGRIEVISLPAESAVQQRLMHLLARSFAEDQMMIGLLGRPRWQAIVEPYFKLQLEYADTAITINDGDTMAGALIARTPGARLPGWRAALQAWRVSRLMGDQYTPSQRIAHAISRHVPSDTHWYINQLGVLPKYQSHGIGHHLIDALKSLRGQDRVYVDCEAALSAFYQSAGFTPLASIEEYEMEVLGLE